MRTILVLFSAAALLVAPTAAVSQKTYSLYCNTTKKWLPGTYATFRACDDAARAHNSAKGHSSGCI